MKKNQITGIVIALVVITATAIGTSISVTLDSSQLVPEQAITLKEYVDQLPQDDQDEWREHFKLLANNIDVIEADLPPGSEDATVYIADTGNRYHLHIGCRVLNSAVTISKVLKEVAIGMGRTPCKICYPHGDGQ